MSPSAAGDTRDLLAASLQATSQAITAHAAMLSLPVVDDAAAQALPADSAVRDRLQEVEFAEASQALRALVQKGDARGARKLLKDLDESLRKGGSKHAPNEESWTDKLKGFFGAGT